MRALSNRGKKKAMYRVSGEDLSRSVEKAARASLDHSASKTRLAPPIQLIHKRGAPSSHVKHCDATTISVDMKS